MTYILFDIGGTKMRIARSDDLAHFDEPIKVDTPLNYREGFIALTNAIDTLSRTSGITAIAGGIRGPLNHEKTGIVSETKLIDWVGRNIVRDLHERYHVPVTLENDTAIVGLGEAVFGAGKGYDIVAYHTVSTGVGGARFVHGVLDMTSVGFEPGHQILDLDRTILGHHTPPTLENLVSGTALEKRRGVKPYDIAQDDPVWDELAGYLAHGLKNTIVYWSPDVIVLGGSMVVGDPRIFLNDIERHTKEVLGDLMPCPPIKDAQFRDDGGLYGAMVLLKRQEGTA
jgi:predicted NBD/HSP70 family sugar kinase